MTVPLTAEKIAEIEAEYMKNPRARIVAKVCSVSEGVIYKYARRGKWKQRYQDIQQRTAKRVDTKRTQLAVDSKNRQLAQAQLLQAGGISGIRDRGQVTQNYRESMDSIVAGVKMEREITGQDTTNIVVTIALPGGMKLEDFE